MLSLNFDINGENKVVNVLLYDHVTLGKKEILPKVLENEVAFVLVRADMIINLFHLKAAVCRALRNCSFKKMKTRSIESEIIYCLNPTTKINEGFQFFGLNDNPRPIIVIKVNNKDRDQLSLKQMEKMLSPVFQSTPIQNEDIDIEIKKLTDYKVLRKVYNLASLSEIENEDPAILNSVISTMAMKWHL
ncbi:CGI-121-domain-containing protein [Neoconidiobolus thromboides FSU 785]|nr:CGI-121-domain-containing protein [Neoconidiobolus thromboides FSU 785]